MDIADLRVGDIVTWKTRSKAEPVRRGEVIEVFVDVLGGKVGDILEVRSLEGKSKGEIFKPHPSKLTKVKDADS